MFCIFWGGSYKFILGILNKLHRFFLLTYTFPKVLFYTLGIKVSFSVVRNILYGDNYFLILYQKVVFLSLASVNIIDSKLLPIYSFSFLFVAALPIPNYPWLSYQDSFLYAEYILWGYLKDINRRVIITVSPVNTTRDKGGL